MSIYRVLSLDRSTGAVKDQMQFEGHWGHMPYLYAAGDGSFLSKNRLLSVGCGNIRLLNDQGKVIFERQNREGAFTFAGANQHGTRFALQASEGRGDPSFYSTNAFSSTMSVLSPRSQ
jgi:hypothetical protein